LLAAGEPWSAAAELPPWWCAQAMRENEDHRGHLDLPKVVAGATALQGASRRNRLDRPWSGQGTALGSLNK